MIEEQALVVGVHGDHAEVVVERHSSCGSCAAKSGCGTSLIADWLPQRQLSFRLQNRVNAVVGDAVVVGLDEGQLQKGSMLLYALPLAGLLIGALLGDAIFRQPGDSSELGTILSGLLGLIASLLLVRHLTGTGNSGGYSGVRLLRVATPGESTVSLQSMQAATHKTEGSGNDS